MKKLIYSFLISALFTSCSPNIYFQVHDVNSDDVKFEGDVYKYEDEFIAIGYNLWEDNGDIGFFFYNKTDSSISIRLEESYYVVNGTAFDYYQQRTSTNSFTNTTHFNSYYYNYYANYYKKSTVSMGTTSHISYQEKNVINIPPHSGKSISEYSIISELYRDCDLFRFPNKKNIKSVNFKEDNTPLKFHNYLTYVFNDETDIERVVRNAFWVSQITNYPKSEIVDSKKNEFCGEQSYSSQEYFTNNSKDRFYFRYTKSDNLIFSH